MAILSSDDFYQGTIYDNLKLWFRRCQFQPPLLVSVIQLLFPEVENYSRIFFFLIVFLWCLPSSGCAYDGSGKRSRKEKWGHFPSFQSSFLKFLGKGRSVRRSSMQGEGRKE